MANMSYCRFENTYRDFMVCVNALRLGGYSELSESERDYADLLRLAAQSFVDEMDELEMAESEVDSI